MSRPTAGRQPNHLIHSTSPYLLQHAYNPVAWRPWGEEAFAEARRREVPIFLSIGYSTCYWCHVMERESFEHDETAAIMNELFVCVKLDREERPDLDELYMAATITMRGHGGWPMSVFLEPDTLRPFYCGTYFPRDARFAGARGMPTFRQVLEGISGAYKSQREDVREQASKLAEAVAEHVATQPPTAPLGAELVEEALSRILAMFDKLHGGFGTAPKFPQPVFLEFLLDAREIASAETRPAIDQAVRVTLDAMAKGGIHDHLAGGFHRYSVDAHWTVPHFEKMLYDQAQLLSVYARAAKVYGDAWYADVARGIVAYVRAELMEGGGASSTGSGAAIRGFWSAQDAEVDGREGLNYVWTPERVREALASSQRVHEDTDLAFALLGLSREANFQDPHHPHEPAIWVLRMDERPDAVAARMGLSSSEFRERFASVRERLLAFRAGRPRPATDDKVLASWNGMMIVALDRAGRELGDASMRELARAAFVGLMQQLRTPQGLLRTARGNAAHTAGLLEDYAWLIRAAVAVGRDDLGYELAREAAGAFSASSPALRASAAPATQPTAWFDTRADQPDLFVRACATHDGAIPSGFATMAHALLDLGDGQSALAALAHQSGRLAASPAGCVESVRALLRILRSPDASLLAPRTDTSHESRPAAASPAAAGTTPDAVQVFASVERLTIGHDAPAQCTLVVQIEPGYHIIAADPRVEGEPAAPGLVPLRIDIHNGGGIAAYADYPLGTPHGVSSAAAGLGRVRVLMGRHEIPVVLERTGEWKGNPLLIVRYQACTDDACLPPVVVELDIALDRA